MKYTASIFILFVFILAACSQSTGKTETTSKNTACYLISSSNKFLMGGLSDEGLPYLQDRKKFIEPYVSSEYRGDTLIAKTLQELNSCGDIEACIEVKGDTIYLLTKNRSDELCNSFNLHEFTYKIKVDKKYVIGW